MKNLKKLAKWFNKLDYKKQLSLYNYLVDFDELHELDSEDRDLFEELIKKINEIAMGEHNNEEFDMIKHLIEAGFEKFFAYPLFNFSKAYLQTFNDSNIVKKLTPQQLDLIVKFVINDVIIYNNYEEMDFDSFVELGGFEDSDSAGRTLRFLNIMINKVSDHELSPEFLRNNLINEHRLPEQLSDIIVSNIKDNLSILEKANIIHKMNMILKKMSSLSCSIE